MIAYVGRDIEDAIILKLIKRDDIPKEITEVLGDDNEKIVNTLIMDLVNNSMDKDSLSFSPDVFNALDQLKRWNFKNIYTNPKKSTQDEKIKNMFRAVFDACLKELESGEKRATGIVHWYEKMNGKYKEANSLLRVVADYVSGMTDDYLMNVYKEIMIPKSYGISFAEK